MPGRDRLARGADNSFVIRRGIGFDSGPLLDSDSINRGLSPRLGTLPANPGTSNPVFGIGPLRIGPVKSAGDDAGLTVVPDETDPIPLAVADLPVITES